MSLVLVIEADASAADDFARLIRHIGHKVVVADSGEDALRKVDFEPVDLAVVATALKGELTGIETAARLRKNYSVPVVLAAASGELGTFDSLKAVKPFGFLQKPLKSEEVYSAIETALYLRDVELDLKGRAERAATMNEKSTQAQRAERLAAIGETAALLGHDLRNPLQVLTNLIYIAKKSFNAMPSPFVNEEQKQKTLDFCAAAEKQIVYLDKIVSNMQDYARQTLPDKRSTAVYDLLSDALSRVAFPSNVTVNIHIDHNAERLNGDPLSISRVFANLIQNAVQAMPQGGRVTISTAKVVDQIAVRFADEGVGIPEANLKSIFQPLTTNKAQGMGFGLAVCDKIIKEHNGRIEVESTVGKGTTFTVFLPLASG